MIVAIHFAIAATMIGYFAAVIALVAALVFADHDAADVWADQ